MSNELPTANQTEANAGYCADEDNDRARLHSEHEHEEEVLHKEHVREEEQLHEAHLREEEELHREHEREEAEEDGPIVTVNVTYNGVTKPLQVNLDGATSTALEAALNLFNITHNRHVMALFTEAGVELNDGQTLRQQGVKGCALLVLRQSTVKGG